MLPLILEMSLLDLALFHPCCNTPSYLQNNANNRQWVDHLQNAYHPTLSPATAESGARLDIRTLNNVSQAQSSSWMKLLCNKKDSSFPCQKK